MWKKIFTISICKNLHELLYLILLLQTATLQFYTEYTLADLRPTVLELNPLLKSNKRPDLKTVRAKYNHPSVHVFQFTYSSLCNYFLLRTFGLRHFIFLYIYILFFVFFLKDFVCRFSLTNTWWWRGLWFVAAYYHYFHYFFHRVFHSVGSIPPLSNTELFPQEGSQ